MGDLIVYIAQLLDHFCTIFVSLCLIVGWNFFDTHIFAIVTVEISGIHIDEIDYAFKSIFLPNRYLNHNRIESEFISELLRYPIRTSPLTIELVHKCKSWHSITFHLTIYG